jgi:hypothetical protein
MGTNSPKGTLNECSDGNSKIPMLRSICYEHIECMMFGRPSTIIPDFILSRQKHGHNKRFLFLIDQKVAALK